MRRRAWNLCKCPSHGSVSQEAAALLHENARRALLYAASRISISAGAENAGAAESLRHVNDLGGQGFREGLREGLPLDASVGKVFAANAPLRNTGERHAPGRDLGWNRERAGPFQAEAGMLARHFWPVRGGASGMERRAIAGSSVLGGSSSRCYSAESTLQPPVTTEPPAKPRFVNARLGGTPRYMLKSDVLWVLRDFSLQPEDVTFIFDPKCRLKFIQVQLRSEEEFRQAQRALSGIGRFGGRYLKLTKHPVAMDDINRELASFRGRSVLMTNLHHHAALDEVERFFAGFSLDSSRPIRIMKMAALSASNTKAPRSNVRNEIETRALVRFKTYLEALRALREKQGAICRENAVELVFIE